MTAFLRYLKELAHQKYRHTRGIILKNSMMRVSYGNIRAWCEAYGSDTRQTPCERIFL